MIEESKQFPELRYCPSCGENVEVFHINRRSGQPREYVCSQCELTFADGDVMGNKHVPNLDDYDECAE